MNGARSGDLVDARAHPAEARRLLTEWARSKAPPGGAWDAGPVDWAVAQMESGTFVGRLWVGPNGDEAVAIALGTPAGEVGGRLEILYLSDGFRNAASVTAVLTRLGAPDGLGPLVEVPDPPHGVEAGEYGAVARGLGFVAIQRADMRFAPARAPPTAPPDASTQLRTATRADVEALAQLTVRAYEDNRVDMALFRRRTDALEDARAGIGMIFGEFVGPPILDASFVAEDADGVVGATLVNDHHGALITQVMVDPRARGRGHATRLLGVTISALRTLGRPDIRLVVTRTNRRAERLYASLGFEVDPGNVGTTWLHAGRLGLTANDLEGV